MNHAAGLGNSTQKIVIFSKHIDAHIPFVAPHLRAETVIIDPAVQVYKGKLSLYAGSEHVSLLHPGRLPPKTNVRSVWYRKPNPIDDVQFEGMDDLQRRYARNAQQHFIEMLHENYFANATWVSDYYAILRANNKALQLSVAARSGFSVPDTLFTSDANVAAQFLHKHPSVLVKSLATEYPKRNGKPTFFFARKLSRDEPVQLGGLNLAPAIFQEAIDTSMDIRATVVGNKVFAATIKGSAINDSAIPSRDWRLGHYEGTMEIKPFDLPGRIAQLCVNHVRELGLLFGAIDLVVDKKGRYWFLENNPNGQWAFIEEETKQPIGRAIADLLMNGA